MLYSVKEQNNNVINSDVKYIQWQKTVLIFCLDLAFFKKMMNILGNICMVGASGFDQIGFVHPCTKAHEAAELDSAQNKQSGVPTEAQQPLQQLKNKPGPRAKYGAGSPLKTHKKCQEFRLKLTSGKNFHFTCSLGNLAHKRPQSLNGTV